MIMASWDILETQEKVYSDYNFKKTNLSFYGIIGFEWRIMPWDEM